MSAPLLGVVADDVTGAGDLADAVCDEGLSAVVLFGVPDGPVPACDCAVVAVTSRTAAVEAAVADSVASARALLAAGAELLYQKYCSTFDSTDAGNIGPVADALRALVDPTGATVTVGTPATPRVGRTVYQGHLFVGRQLLSQSPLRDHPLTPMRDPDLVAVLGRQTPQPVGLVARSVIAAGPSAVRDAIADAADCGARHVLLDALDDDDLGVAAAAIGKLATGDRPIVAGGAAGLAAALARQLRACGSVATAGRQQHSRERTVAAPGAPRLVIAGSCAERTRAQVAAFGGPVVALSPLELADDANGTVERVVAAVTAALRSGRSPVLVSSSADPAAVATAEARLGPGRAAGLLEAAAGAIARRGVRELGVRRLIVAGGETSGAVVAALGLTALRVGPAVGPGLPWLVPDGDDALALLLKSGNFGEPDLFTTAWDACP